MARNDQERRRPSEADPGPGPGTLLAGRFELRSLLGEGAIGRVWSALDHGLREEAAVKLLRPELAASPEVAARFEREVRLARRVTHPGVCRTHDQGHDERFGPFITMQLLGGETLAARLERSGSWEPRAAARLLAAIAEALAAAHAAEVVHRDLKTANVMLVPDGDGVRPVLTDFGLARTVLVESGASATRTGEIVGSPAYMAPEQVRGEPAGPATDVYALGVIAFELVTGELPFRGESALATAIQRLEREPPAPGERRPGLDPRWDAAVLRALALDPVERFADPRELARALLEGAAAETGHPLPTAGPIRHGTPRPAAGVPALPAGARGPGRRVSARRATAAVAAALAVALLPALGLAERWISAAGVLRADAAARAPGHTTSATGSVVPVEHAPAAGLAPPAVAPREGEVRSAPVPPAGREDVQAAARGDGSAAKGERARDEAEAWMAAGNDRFRGGDPEAARGLYERAAASFRRAGDRGREAAARNNLGNALAIQGELTAATPHYRASLALRRQGDDREMLLRTLFNLGRHLYRAADFDGARTTFEELLVEARRDGDRKLAAQGLLALASLLHLRGDLPQADRALREALILRRAEGAAATAASVELSLGLVLVQRGELDEAKALLTSASAVFREGDRSGLAWTLDSLGDALGRLGDDAGAAAALAEAAEIWREAGDRAAAARTAVARSRLALDRGQLVEARRHLEPALATLTEIGGSEGLHAALHAQGELARLTGDPEGAHRAHSRALELRYELGSVLGQVESLCALAEVALDRRLPVEAAALARAAAADARRAGAADLELAADLLLARALLASGEARAARETLSRHLPPERASASPWLRLETAIVSAQVRAARGDPGEPEALAELEAAARAAGRPALVFAAALARATAAGAAGDAAGATARLVALRDEADAAGYVSFVRRAEAPELSSSPPAPPPPSLKLAGSIR